MAKKQSASSLEVEKLENERRKLDNKLRKAREAESDRRGLGGYRDVVTEVTKNHNEMVERQTGYDTTDKARTFGFASFDGALDGALRWVRVDSVYAIEVEAPSVDSGHKTMTMLKTVDGPVDVKQSPDEVFNEFTEVRFAGSAERVREMQGELLRREDKVNETKAKAKEKAAKALAKKGPDFQAVSDQVTNANGDAADRGEDLGEINPVDDESALDARDDGRDDDSRPDGGIH